MSTPTYRLDKSCVVQSLGHQRREFIFNFVSIMSEMTMQTDPLTVLHPYRVAHLSVEIAEALSLEEAIKEEVYLAGILHDTGKMYIDSNILKKETSLTDEEYNILKNHSVYGANIVKSVTGSGKMAVFVKHHHERYDGRGYPSSLKGKEIPLISRIISVADAVDAMLSQRIYKPSRTVSFVTQELLKNSGSQFDSYLTDIAINILFNSKTKELDLSVDSILWGNLTIITTKGTYAVQGAFITYGCGHFFRSNTFNFLTKVSRTEIIEAELAFCISHNIVFEYQVQLDYFEENQVYIHRIKRIL
jgi:putative nucleotidyltransferase with HDIG domain